jgi:peptidoglycan/LPS O-acetylase OafA/YrhL
LYLLHVVVLGQVTRLIPDLGARPAPVRLAAGVAFLLLAVGCATLSHRWVELPAQALGRRILAARTITVATQRAVPPTARGDNADGSV